MTRAINAESIHAVSDSDLFRIYGLVMEEFKERGLTRSSNNPAADYAELLIARQFGVAPAGGVQTGYDVLTVEGLRIQVKARRLGAGTRPPYYGWIRKLEQREFDKLAAVLFNADFTVSEADLVSWEAVETLARYNDRVGAHRLPLVTPMMRAHPGVEPLNLGTPP